MSKNPLAACWNCSKALFAYILPGVRRTKCAGCGAVHPTLRKREVAEFVNENKTYGLQ